MLRLRRTDTNEYTDPHKDGSESLADSRGGACLKQPLRNQVAVVAGATRGAGRGIARMLEAAGATVYCTGRSVRGRPATLGRPETIEETAALVTAEGARGIAVCTDHTVESAVEQVFARVRASPNLYVVGSSTTHSESS